MEYKILDTSPFKGIIHKVEIGGQCVFIGVANYKDGCDIYFPEAGTEHVLIMLNNSIYRFRLSEFTNPCSLSYIAEKLHCSEQSAEFVYQFVQDILMKNAAHMLLLDRHDYKNPFLI